MRGPAESAIDAPVSRGAATALEWTRVPSAMDGGPIGIPEEVLLVSGVGLAVFLALLVGTSVTRPKAPAADPLLDVPDETAVPLSGGAWRRISRLDGAFDAGLELGRHVTPRTVPDVVRALRSLDLGSAEVARVSATETSVHMTNCGSCAKRAWWRGRRGDCAFERGFLTGAFESVLDAPVRVEEQTCGGGKNPCRFRLRHDGGASTA